MVFFIVRTIFKARDGSVFFFFSCLLIFYYCSEQEVEHFGRFTKSMDDNMVRLKARCQEHCEHHSGSESLLHAKTAGWFS